MIIQTDLKQSMPLVQLMQRSSAMDSCAGGAIVTSIDLQSFASRGETAKKSAPVWSIWHQTGALFA
jgi:hypothetical protein